ncbi:ribose 5-phosphate isomerase B [Candidatus Woesearchaeota archaeon CG10_big_fil_rev_8_21_14_0_10_44_13]|nr:MAG: ribose 5-phosphate isomerase B [Candidatus Woesearchaeota archaeon CG10_big_fil_rev_8_21_14_0_10_44_13]
MAKEAVIIGSDHAGFRLKEALKKAFQRKISIVDMGAYSTDPVDYPDIAKKVAKKVKAGRAEGAKGILICGSGTGMCIAANRFKGIRAVAAYDAYSARMSRLDNDSNILCLRGRNFSPAKAKGITSIWLKTGFSGKKRHSRRIRKLDRL